MLPLIAAAKAREVPEPRLTSSESAQFAMQQGVVGMGYLKEKWTEQEVSDLPTEHGHVERKSGQLLDDDQHFCNTMAKALSAFANSGGGWIILGIEDDGKVDGLPPRVGKGGRTPTKDWLEQRLPLLVEWPLQEFRVHAVERAAAGSAIPPDRELYVIDIGDSRLAPHQAISPKDKPCYYYRQAGKSVPAPHHYLEALRNRITFAVLESELERVAAVRVFPDVPEKPVAVLTLRLKVRNVSRVACSHWAVDVGFDEESLLVTTADLRRIGSNSEGFTIERGLLPTREDVTTCTLGFRLCGGEVLDRDIRNRILPLKIHHYPISDNFIGPRKSTPLSDVTDAASLRKMILDAAAKAGIKPGES